MKVLFLNPPFLPGFSRSQRSPAVTKSGTLYYPFWLAYAAGLLEENGFEVKLLDSPARRLNHEQTLRIVKDYSPRLLVIDTSTPSIYNDVEIADKLKSLMPDCFCLLVGTHVTVLAQESLELSKKIDAIARGEYDLTILDLARNLRENVSNCEGISGLTFRKSGTIIHNPGRPLITDLDRLPFVSKVYKKHLSIKDYFFAASLYPEVQIFTARGCPFRCFFCLWPQTFSGRAYRARSPKNVVDEFIYIKNELPEAKGVVIEDDTFTVDNRRAVEICELLIEKKVNLKWNANVRTDLDIQTMRLMKRAGCYLIITGFESVNQEILNNINKGLNSSNIVKFFDNAKKCGLLMHAAFMAGNPGETESTLRDNLILAKKYLPDTAQFFPLMPYPGTKAYAWAKEKGYLKINSYRDYLTKEGYHNCVIDLPGLSSGKLLDWCDKSRRSFYLNPKYVFYKLMQLLFRPQEAIRTLKALARFRKHILKNPKI
jgi:radical SAM superfamily enzyme YgiQ (UPF0313 family)